MTDELLGRYINAELREILNKEMDQVLGKFLACGDGEEPITPQTLKLLTTAVLLSSQLSVQYMLRYLEEQGVLQLPDDGVPVLRILKDDPPKKPE